MTAQSSLEQHGTFAENPFAELLVEILQARFSGALRVSGNGQKAIIYFHGGAAVFAVSNAKSNRLFSILLQRGKISKEDLAGFKNFANDMELAAHLTACGTLTKAELEESFTTQMTCIIVDVLTWPEGEWTFDPRVQARRDLQYPIDLRQILANYARCASAQHVMRRFRSVQESFSVVGENFAPVALQAHEVEVLEKFEIRPLTVEELRKSCPVPDSTLFHTLYVLWLCGFLVRHHWNAAFNSARIESIHTVRMAKVKSAADAPTVKEKPPEVKPPRPETLKPVAVSVPLPEVNLSLPEYLRQVEEAETHYDALGVEVDADASLIKHSYFSLAKKFHPDLFNREAPDLLKRIQSAFTVVAHAHETLRSPEAREAYNSKMYREIEKREKRKAEGVPDATSSGAEHGLESFEEGLKMIADEEFELAAGYLARAVHYSPQNALYHAYFGQALAGCDDKQRHKAESELQTAVKLDPANAKIRMMLVDFLVSQKMLKRAEGELKRFLAIAPGNKEATEMLAKLA